MCNFYHSLFIFSSVLQQVMLTGPSLVEQNVSVSTLACIQQFPAHTLANRERFRGFKVAVTLLKLWLTLPETNFLLLVYVPPYAVTHTDEHTSSS